MTAGELAVGLEVSYITIVCLGSSVGSGGGRRGRMG